jgi:hypothetical protein
MLPSPLTIKYFEALDREGDKFDFDTWLARVRREQAAERGVRTTAADHGVEPLNMRTDGPGIGHVPRRVIGSEKQNAGRSPRRPAKEARNAVSESTKARLFKVCDVWEKISEDRSRDSIYRYLKAAYSLVSNCQRQGRAAELLQAATKVADLAESKNPELFSTVIRSTCDGVLDPKSVSKFSRALRYAAYRDRPPRMLKSFIKGLGGINGAADRYAKRLGRARKSS